MQLADYKQLVEVIGDAVVVCDAAGAITVWNDAAVRMFGFTREDAMGKSLDISEHRSSISPYVLR